MDDPILRVRNLSKQYDGIFNLEIPRLEFQSGGIYAIIGPNGAGKTTLLNLLSLLESPTSGEIFFKGQRVSRFNSLSIRRKVSMIMENPWLFHTTVFKNITSGLKCRSVNKKKWPEVVTTALQMVSLTGFEKRYAPELSSGETQRVALARALALEPEVLFLDEPFSNIDKINVRLLEKLIQRINRKHQTTIVFTTHDQWQAHRLADTIISLVGGRIVNGSLENLFKGMLEEVDGSQFARLSADVSVSVVTDKMGEAHVCIPPQDIILSHEHMESSARNSFKGIVRKIHMEGQVVKLVIEVAAGVEFTAIITKTSYENMNLSIDSQTYVTFKSTSVNIF